MIMNKIAMAIFVIASFVLPIALAQDYGYCINRVCRDGVNSGLRCEYDEQCNSVYAFNDRVETSLAADITLGVMGVAVAAIVTLVGFTIYAKNTTPKRRRR